MRFSVPGKMKTARDTPKYIAYLAEYDDRVGFLLVDLPLGLRRML